MAMAYGLSRLQDLGHYSAVCKRMGVNLGAEAEAVSLHARTHARTHASIHTISIPPPLAPSLPPSLSTDRVPFCVRITPVSQVYRTCTLHNRPFLQGRLVFIDGFSKPYTDGQGEHRPLSEDDSQGDGAKQDVDGGCEGRAEHDSPFRTSFSIDTCSPLRKSVANFLVTNSPPPTKLRPHRPPPPQPCLRRLAPTMAAERPGPCSPTQTLDHNRGMTHTHTTVPAE
jgi:hypothetical protein